MRLICRFSVPSALLACLALVAGCSSGPKLQPVSGKVTVGKAPLKGGAITFIPDTSKGNTAKVSPTGSIGSDGSYTVSTEGKPGAPAGWYKVTVMTNMPGSEPSTVKLDPIYSDPARTNLAVEVTTDSSKTYDVPIP